MLMVINTFLQILMNNISQEKAHFNIFSGIYCAAVIKELRNSSAIFERIAPFFVIE